MQNILVTGGAGYIGSHTVVELHNAGYNPIIVDNLSNSRKSVLTGLKNITGKDFAFYKVDCNDKEAFRQVFKDHQISGVIHFAAFKAVGESVAKPLEYYENNVGSLMTLIRNLTNSQLRSKALRKLPSRLTATPNKFVKKLLRIPRFQISHLELLPYAILIQLVRILPLK